VLEDDVSGLDVVKGVGALSLIHPFKMLQGDGGAASRVALLISGGAGRVSTVAEGGCTVVKVMGWPLQKY
jgi:hypothetical protein